MTKTTIKNRTERGRLMAYVSENLVTILLVVSLVLHIAGAIVFYSWEDLRYSIMRYDPDAVEELTEEAKARERERKKKEEEKRERTELREEDAEELVEVEENKKKREMQERIEDIRQANEELEEIIEEKYEEMALEEMGEEMPPMEEVPLAQQEMPEPLTDRELAELIREKSGEIEDENRAIGEDYGDKRMYERARAKREELAKASSNLSLQMDMKLGQKDLSKSDLVDILPTIDKVLDKSWEMTRSNSSLTAPIRHDLKKLERQKRENERNKQITSSERARRAEKLAQKIEREKQNLDEALETSRKSQNITQKALEINQTTLEHLATHMARNMDQMTVNDMFETAKMMEEMLAKNFAQFRAQELAQIQGTSMEEALGKIHVPDQQRPDMSEQLNDENIQTVGDLNTFRQSLNEAMGQMESMRANAQSMLNQAKGLNQQREHGASMNMAAMQRAMNSAALSQGGRQVTDMTRMMGAVNWMGGGTGDHYAFDPRDNREGGGEYFKPQTKLASQRLNRRMIEAQAMPGRKFTEDSRRKGWLYLDTWYVIGPWENNGRIDYDVVHPPETLIDLDAEYEGKIDKQTKQPMELKWQFFQSSKIRHTPPDERSNSTYYAYTEVYFEKETQMLLAVGTDDAAKVWINDLVIWRDEGLSSWNMEEGYRKVLFKKGYNKILIRIENGPAVCQFSVLLCPPEALPGLQ